jgi:sugar/nucleoside kinase (ribokinase family)
MALTPGEMLRYLRERGCRIGGVTLGPRGIVWYDESGSYRMLPALYVPRERVIDANGAGDIFHGAYIYSSLVASELAREEHFRFARAAAAHAIRHLGNEASLLADIERAQTRFDESRDTAAVAVAR